MKVNWKELARQKTFWAGLALIVTGIGTLVADGETAKGIETIIAGIGLIFLRQAVAKVQA